MATATILAHLGDGQYTVQVERNLACLEAVLAVIVARLAEIEAKLTDLAAQKTEKESEIAAIQAQISALIDANDIRAIMPLFAAGFEAQAELGDIIYSIAAANMQKLQLMKRRNVLESTQALEDIRDVWCADLTEDLSGEVPTCEVNGELTHAILYPGQSPAAPPADHGGLVPVIGQTAAQAALNFCIHPGWQKWKPTYRIGIITSIDYDDDTCSLTLDLFNKSHYQNLNINQTDTLESVPISYMTCNAAAFEVDDRVLVRFDGQDWTAPRVIGFESEPQPCEECFIEPWDGPDLESKHPWVHLWQWFKMIPPDGWQTGVTDNSTTAFESEFGSTDTHLRIDIADIPGGGGWSNQEHVWRILPVAPEIAVKENATKIKFNVNFETLDTSGLASALGRFFEMVMAGKAVITKTELELDSETGFMAPVVNVYTEDVYFTLHCLSTNAEFGRPRIGYTGFIDGTDWYHHAPSAGVWDWRKGWERNQGEFVDLPISEMFDADTDSVSVNIELAQLYFESGHNVTLLWGDLGDIPGFENLMIKHIEIC